MALRPLRHHDPEPMHILLTHCMLQAVADIQKRRGGAPTSGRVSIVVTDIESYSGREVLTLTYALDHDRWMLLPRTTAGLHGQPVNESSGISCSDITRVR